jgi:hypothetical protein
MPTGDAVNDLVFYKYSVDRSWKCNGTVGLVSHSIYCHEDKAGGGREDIKREALPAKLQAQFCNPTWPDLPIGVLFWERIGFNLVICDLCLVPGARTT